MAQAVRSYRRNTVILTVFLQMAVIHGLGSHREHFFCTYRGGLSLPALLRQGTENYLPPGIIIFAAGDLAHLIERALHMDHIALSVRFLEAQQLPRAQAGQHLQAESLYKLLLLELSEVGSHILCKEYSQFLRLQDLLAFLYGLCGNNEIFW